MDEPQYARMAMTGLFATEFRDWFDGGILGDDGRSRKSSFGYWKGCRELSLSSKNRRKSRTKLSAEGSELKGDKRQVRPKRKRVCDRRRQTETQRIRKLIPEEEEDKRSEGTQREQKDVEEEKCSVFSWAKDVEAPWQDAAAGLVSSPERTLCQSKKFPWPKKKIRLWRLKPHTLP